MIDPLNPWAVPLLNTILLLSSGATVTYSHHSLIQGNRRGAIYGLLATLVLAIIFTALQGFEYYNAPFTISDSVYGSCFYLATGTHGLHVIVGTLFLSVGLFRLLAYHLTDHHHQGYESAILYWHFVDVVWLFCAPLWISFGSVLSNSPQSYDNTVAPVRGAEEHDTIVATKLCNLINLPDAEMARGLQHVGKVGDGPLVYELLRGIIDQGHSIEFGGAPQNPFSIAIFNAICLIENIRYIVAVVTPGNNQLTKPGPKIDETERESIKGLPKGSNFYGDGVPIVGIRKGRHSFTEVGQRTLSTSSFAVNEKYINGRDLMSKMKVRDEKYSGLYKLICNEDILFGAYYEIKSKPGNMTPGSDGKTLDGISQKLINEISIKLINETFQFKPSKRIWIPKANGKMRPLGIPSPRDKIVQQAMALLLNLIYEPEFKQTNHGYRPNRGCHTALAQISKWSGTLWAIEGDIKGFFDNVNHQLLANLLQKKIRDQQFIDLYWKMVKAGYVEEGVKRDSLLGIPQGGIVSPILSNIYLHEFDLFMEGLIDKHHSTAKDITTRNPVYDKVTRRIQYLRDKYPQVAKRSKDISKEIDELRRQRRTIPSRLPNGTRLRYVRYADDWIVGVYGPLDFVSEIKNKIATFLNKELGLELSLDKTKITNLLHDKALFLGFYIQIHRPKESNFHIRKIGDHFRKSKISHNRVWLLVPVDRILNKLSDEGFLKNYSKGSVITTSAKTSWIFLSHRDIVARYNMLTRGLLRYYSIATNRSVFHLIVNYILRHSCAKTLARKFRLRSRNKVFKTFGYSLKTCEEPRISFYTEPHYKRLKKWPKHITATNPFEFLNWRLRTQFHFWEPCLICGTTENIEMHHVKHIRKSNQKAQGFTQLMSRLNRKQIPVCKNCHVQIHNGKYDGISLKELQVNKN